jgi:predicted metal-binding protein
MRISDGNFRLLEEKAKEQGAKTVRVIPAADIVVENRTVLKCRFGCNGYGSQVCPPFIPEVEEFRKMLNEYEWVLLVDWKSENVFSREISGNFVKYSIIPPEDKDTRQRYQDTLRTVLKERKERIQPGSIELEKLAWSLGYNTALATFPGMCTWCANSDYSAVNCARSDGACHHPTIRRPCLMGLGIRLDKTLEKLGTPLQGFPMNDTIPSQYTLILLE